MGVMESDELERLRRQIAVMSGRPDQRSVDVRDRSDDVLAVPEALADVLPRRGIARGGVVAVSGARSILMAMIATVSGSGAHVGIVGMPNLNLESIVEWGGDLSRIATVPEPGVDPVEVATVLLDGMDLVVLGMAGNNVPPSRARVVMGRLRKQCSTLLTDARWPGAQLWLDAEVLTYRHVPGAHADADLADARRGYGRIGGMSLQVTVTDRGRRQRVGEIDVVASSFDGKPQLQLVAAPTRPELGLAVAN